MLNIPFYAFGLLLPVAICVIVILLIVLRRGLLGILCTVGFLSGLLLLVLGLRVAARGPLTDEYAWEASGSVYALLPASIIMAASLIALGISRRSEK